MRDGVRLATDVYLPAAASDVPAILVRLPYDKNSRYVFMQKIAVRATNAGYALVVQDVRGKYRSEGEPVGPINEAADGYDTIEWVVNQEWSNGDVGMFGDSYYGFTQWAAVSSGHPALRAIVPRVTTTVLPSIDRFGGADQDQPRWLTGAKYLAGFWTGPAVEELDLDLTGRPLSGVFEDEFERQGRRSLWYDAVFPRATAMPVFRDGHPFDKNPIPVMHVVGWFDNIAIPAMRDYTELCARPGWSSLQYLYADSIDHENYHLSRAPIQPVDDHNENAAALERVLDTYIDPALEFFDVFLKKAAGTASIPRVRWHLGHVGYRTSEQWPPPESTAATLYLTRLADAGIGRGRLADAPPTGSEKVDWTYDPDDLTPSAVPDSFAFLYPYPDESPTSDRSDVLVFDSMPLGTPVDVAGPVELWLGVRSSAPSFDLFAKLLDVSPDGSARMVVRGQIRVPTGDGSESVRIEMGHTGYRLRPGHRFRLHLQSSDFPEFAPQSGTDQSSWTAAVRKPSTQMLSTSPQSPARLSLHVLPSP